MFFNFRSFQIIKIIDSIMSVPILLPPINPCFVLLLSRTMIIYISYFNLYIVKIYIAYLHTHIYIIIVCRGDTHNITQEVPKPVHAEHIKGIIIIHWIKYFLVIQREFLFIIQTCFSFNKILFRNVFLSVSTIL